jgi:hypothetical protein
MGGCVDPLVVELAFSVPHLINMTDRMETVLIIFCL